MVIYHDREVNNMLTKITLNKHEQHILVTSQFHKKIEWIHPAHGVLLLQTDMLRMFLMQVTPVKIRGLKIRKIWWKKQAIWKMEGTL